MLSTLYRRCSWPADLRFLLPRAAIAMPSGVDGSLVVGPLPFARFGAVEGVCARKFVGRIISVLHRVWWRSVLRL